MGDLGSTEEFVRSIPKAELHAHIEGMLTYEAAVKFAKRNGVPPPRRFTSAAGPQRYLGLDEFFEVYFDRSQVLRTGADFHDLATEYFATASRDGVVHAEIFFDPQTHIYRGVAIGDIIQGLYEALSQARKMHGILGGLILCVMRHLGVESANQTIAAAEPYLDMLLGIGLDSYERGNPPRMFKGVFDTAARLGLRRVAHAGEEGPPEYIWDALDYLGAERIDHGISCLQDSALVDRLVRDQVPLTVCPLSNVALGVVPSLAKHPLRNMLNAGLLVSIHSDDSAYFGGSIVDNYVATAEALGLSLNELRRLAENSLTSVLSD